MRVVRYALCMWILLFLALTADAEASKKKQCKALCQSAVTNCVQRDCKKFARSEQRKCRKACKRNIYTLCRQYSGNQYQCLAQAAGDNGETVVSPTSQPTTTVSVTTTTRSPITTTTVQVATTTISKPPTTSTILATTTTTATPQWPPSGGMVSLSFDDGVTSIYTEALPIMSQYGLRGTAYIYPLPIEEGYEGFMTWGEVENLSKVYGWEIGSHSYSHPYLAQIPVEEMQTEIELAYSALSSHGIFVKGFASPFGEYNYGILSHAAKYHTYHRAAFGGTYNSFPYNDYELQAVQVAYDMAPSEVAALVDEAIRNNTWLILYMHKLVEGIPEPYTYNVGDFRAIVSYIADSQALVLPVSEALEVWGNGPDLVFNGDFESGPGANANGWNRTDAGDVQVISGYEGNAPFPLRSVMITGGERELQIFSYPVPVEDTKSYVIRMFSKVEGMTSGSANVWVSELDANELYLGGQWLGGIYGDSISVEYLKYVPTPGAAYLELFLYTLAGSNCTWQIDSVEMKEEAVR